MLRGGRAAARGPSLEGARKTEADSAIPVAVAPRRRLGRLTLVSHMPALLRDSLAVRHVDAGFASDALGGAAFRLPNMFRAFGCRLFPNRVPACRDTGGGYPTCRLDGDLFEHHERADARCAGKRTPIIPYSRTHRAT